MDNVEEQILAYPHLSLQRQREVESYVESNPEWASLLRDVRALEGFVQGASSVEGITEGLLRTYVVVQYIHPDQSPPALREAFSDLEARLEDDSALQERVETIRRTLEETESAIDPVAQFEELTGHQLDPVEADASAKQTADAVASDAETATPLQSFIDDLLRLPLALRGAGVAAVLLIAAYGALFVVSESSESTLDRLAAVEVSEQVVENYSTRTRSAVPSSDSLSADDLYLEALDALQNARTSTLGLFPRYDAEKLQRAEELLTTVLDQTEGGSFLALEARFYLGKVYLAQEQIEAARSNFKVVVQREGRKTQEALDILEALQEEYPVGTTPEEK